MHEVHLPLQMCLPVLMHGVVNIRTRMKRLMKLSMDHREIERHKKSMLVIMI